LKNRIFTAFSLITSMVFLTSSSVETISNFTIVV
jgi:hypothetical protein